MIKRYLMLLFVLLGLSSCESTVGPSFEEMIPEDLAIYNEGLEPDEQVVCQPAHSDWIDNKYRHVPKWCKTVGYIKNYKIGHTTTGQEQDTAVVLVAILNLQMLQTIQAPFRTRTF